MNVYGMINELTAAAIARISTWIGSLEHNLQSVWIYKLLPSMAVD
jgi:hypothetical protein